MQDVCSHFGWILMSKNDRLRLEHVKNWPMSPELLFLEKASYAFSNMDASIILFIAYLLSIVSMPNLNISGHPLLVWSFFISTCGR